MSEENIMSRYQPLADFLSSKKGDQWEASFADVEAALGRPLPQSAYKHPAWWANQTTAGHSQTHGWRSAGWRTAALDLQQRRVRFERDRASGRATARETSDDVEALITRARELTGVSDRQRLIIAGLKALIGRETALRLAELGGTMPDFTAPARERP